MNTIAVIFAGGVGSRMKKATKPKQFLELDGKPIIVHTISKFDNCSAIDGIAIACKEEYIEYLYQLFSTFAIRKVKWIVPGGNTAQLSVFYALDALQKDKHVAEDAIVLIHDGVRPLIDEQLIVDNIATARSHGNAITVVKASETVFVSHDSHNIDELLKREDVYYARAPQTFLLQDIHRLHLREMESGHYNNIDSCSMAYKHGYRLEFVTCKTSNLKITTDEDYHVYRALYEMEKAGELEMLLR